MSLQFLLCSNPNMPEQGEFVLHAKYPRFLAKVTHDGLELVEAFDVEATIGIEGKLKRGFDWYLFSKMRSRKNG